MQEEGITEEFNSQTDLLKLRSSADTPQAYSWLTWLMEYFYESPVLGQARNEKGYSFDEMQYACI